jgi:hypothetical protein
LRNIAALHIFRKQVKCTMLEILVLYSYDFHVHAYLDLIPRRKYPEVPPSSGSA